LPCAWQGWLVLLAYVVVTTLAAIFLAEEKRLGLFIAVVTVCSIVFIAVVWMKGEKPRWRWGGD